MASHQKQKELTDKKCLYMLMWCRKMFSLPSLLSWGWSAEQASTLYILCCSSPELLSLGELTKSRDKQASKKKTKKN